jgi:hypothetical protein
MQNLNKNVAARRRDAVQMGKQGRDEDKGKEGGGAERRRLHLQALSLDSKGCRPQLGP